MWMTSFVREVKRQLRDVYGIAPSRIVDDEPCFDSLPDGLYPMEIEGKIEQVVVISNHFHFLEKKTPKCPASV